MSDFKSIKNKLSALKSKVKSEATTTTPASTPAVVVEKKNNKPVAATKEVNAPSTTTSTVSSSTTTSNVPVTKSEPATTTPAVAVEKKNNNNQKKAKQQPKPKKNTEKKAPSTTTPPTTTTTTPSSETTEASTTTTTSTPSETKTAKPVKKSSAKDTKEQKEKKQGVKRKQPETEDSSEKKDSKKKNKNKKSKKAIKAAIKTFVLKLEVDNIHMTEDKVKECFPEQNAIIRMGPRMILIQFPTEEIGLKYLTGEDGQVVKNRRTEINGEKFKITKHTVKEIFNPRWYDVKPRVTEGVSLALLPGQKVNGKFGAYLELHLKEKLGSETNTSISDMEKGLTVFFEDAKTEEKFKAMIQNGEFKVPSEYINDKKKKGPAKKKAKKF